MKSSYDDSFRRQIKQALSGQPASPAAAPGPRSAAADILFSQAVAHHQAGQLPQAEALYRQILGVVPSHAGALHLLGVIAAQVGQHGPAIELIDKAIQIDPQYAEAYYNRGKALYALGRSQEALESFDQAVLLKPDYAEAYHNRGSALCALRQYHAALESYDKAIQLKPDYAQAVSDRDAARRSLRQYQTVMENYEVTVLASPDFELQKGTAAFASAMKKIGRIAKIKDKARMKEELDALPPAIRSHPDVCNLRNAHFVKTDSSGKDLVFYCYPAGEIWNPETARTKGIGGSEEAVIWLSRLLHERGWKVTVYASCGPEEKEYDGVSWKPYWMWNYHDKQDVTVLWRAPTHAASQINSDKVIVDLHDIVPEDEFPAEGLRKIHKIFLKSRFQRSLYPQIPDEKVVILPNGIDARLFDGSGERDPLLLINTSSADRSLEAFLDCFEEIRKQVPDAKAQWAYGWGFWDFTHSSDAEMMQWKTRMQQRMKQLGVEERGRISHAEIARLYRRANIFAYPTEFAEIDCISLSKAMAAGAMPLTTDFAALGEKSQHGGVFLPSQRTKDDWAQPGQFQCGITDPGQKAEFVREAVKLLLNPPSEQEREPMREWARSTFAWDKIADRWNEVLTAQAEDSASAPGPMDRAAQENRAKAQIEFDRGNRLFAAGQNQQALESYDKAIQLNPEYAEAYHNRGSALCAQQQYQTALESYDQAIQLKPEFADARFGRGNALYVLRQYRAALESYDKAVLLKPDYPDAYSSRGLALLALAEHQAALESFDKAIQLKPDYAEAHFGRGTALCAMGRYESSLESLDRAIQLKPDYGEAHNNRGNTLQIIGRYEAALESYDKAILLKPQHAEVHNNRGNTLRALMQYPAALESYDRAIQLKPEFAEVHNNRSNILQLLKQYPAALESLNKANQLKPDQDYLQGMQLHLRRFLCDWEDIESLCRQLETRIMQNERAADPFASVTFSSSPAIQRQAAEIYARDKWPVRATAAFAHRPKRDRIRIGYFSADYYNHATSYLMAEIFERHNRDRFEVLGFSFGPAVVDEMSQRVSAAMDRFLEVRSMTDREIADLSRRLEVDIAVDLKGFTRNNRTGIFAERAAPIQVNYLGYPGTMGAEYMDYLIADQTVIPEASRQYYSEKIVCLPDSYQCNDSRRAISAKPCSRAGERLPETAFVFCCFNMAHKITPAVFDIWMRVLRRTEGSVLWLLEDNPWASENLRKEAMRRGISAERLVFAKTLPLDEHLARLRLADLVLDTLPYNAHTTASDALWAGVPVLTRMGETFAGRVAASLLRAVNLPELITTTEAEYEELAVELAHNPERPRALGQRLEQGRLSARLFDSRAFTCHLEAAYTAMVERYDAGLPPDHILVPQTFTLSPAPAV